jgi:uncharacterized protein involved in outer membrane biogenesis
MRILKWSLAVFCALVVIAGAAGWYFLVHDTSWLRGTAERMLSEAAGRDVRLGGLQIAWSRRPRLIVDDLHIANVDWGAEPEMAAIRRLEIAVDAPELLRGRLVLPEIVLAEPRVLLERRADGTANWSFGPADAAEAAAPENRREMPLIGRLDVQDGKLRYRDEKAGLEIDGEVGTLKGEGGEGHAQVGLTGQGKLQGQAFRLKLTGGSLLQLREGDEPYPLAIELLTETTRSAIEGTLDDPITFDGLSLAVALKGDNLGRLSAMTGVPLPETPPYDLSGQLRRDGGVWAIGDLRGKVGGSDIAGTLRIDTGRERLYIAADLVSEKLDYRDVGPLIGVRVDYENGVPKAVPRKPKAGEDFARVLPDAHLNVKQVREVDADVKYRAAQVLAPGAPLDRVDLDLEMKNGLLRLKPLRVSVAGGDVIAAVAIDARQREVRTNYDIGLRRFRLEEFLAKAGLEGKGAGQIDGQIRLAGVGDTVAASLGSANGDIRIVMAGGTMSKLGLELAGLDVAEALGFWAGGDKPADLRCVVVDLGVEKGVATSRLMLVDTSDSNLTGEGSINLGSEAMDLRFAAHPKDPSPLTVRTPITVGGHLGSPRIGIDARGAAARTAGAIALGVLLTPLAAILAFIEPGLEKDSECSRLLADAAPENTPRPTPPPASRPAPAR